MVANIILTIACHLLMLFIPLLLSLYHYLRRLYIDRGLEDLERRSLTNRQEISELFPGYFQGFEIFVISKKKEAFLKRWSKDLRWIRSCKLSFEDMPEYIEA